LIYENQEFNYLVIRRPESYFILRTSYIVYQILDLRSLIYEGHKFNDSVVWKSYIVLRTSYIKYLTSCFLPIASC